jgi:hypothetical protein
MYFTKKIPESTEDVVVMLEPPIYKEIPILSLKMTSRLLSMQPPMTTKAFSFPAVMKRGRVWLFISHVQQLWDHESNYNTDNEGMEVDHDEGSDNSASEHASIIL